MLKRRLGNTSIEISSLGLGVWQFSNGGNFIGGYWSALSREHMRDIVVACLANGINWFVTAQMYGNGTSERNLAQALQDAQIHPGQVVIATKWNPTFKTADNIGKTIGERIDNLKPFPLDLHQIHNPFSISPVEKQIHAMADLLDAGKIRSIGVSNFSAQAMAKADDLLRTRGHSLASNQVHYNLVVRGIERNGILQEAKDRGITIIAWSPLEQGLLSGRFHRDPTSMARLPWMRRGRLAIQGSVLKSCAPLIDVLERVAGAHQASMAQVALAALVNAHGNTVVAIPGASSTEQVVQNAAAMNLSLSNDELGAIMDVSSRFV